MLSLHQLLNPVGGTTDSVSSAGALPLATPSNSLFADAKTLSNTSIPSHTTQFHISINRETTLDTLHTYTLDTLLEYPETSPTGHIGHLFTLDKSNWSNPVLGFMYSQGHPKGQSKKSQNVYCNVLVDEFGMKVPCRAFHSTCQGCKVCPYTDWTTVIEPHCHASREVLKSRLIQEKKSRIQTNSPMYDVYEKTLTLWSALIKTGCGAPCYELTTYSGTDLMEHDRHQAQLEMSRRGHDAKITCDGHLLFEHDHNDNAYVRCEHYNPSRNKDHLINFDIGKGLYDLAYLEALFRHDTIEIQRIEDDAYLAGFDPQAACMTVSNFSSLKSHCPCEHRNGNGDVDIAQMEHLPCKSRIRVYEPLEDFRAACPRVLVVCHGEHTHPIPLPIKTPPVIRSEVMQLLRCLDHDLPDLTPRRFLRHPIVCAYLRENLPYILHPTLSDLHPSLANRQHINAYIKQAKEEWFPHGTGWEGLVHMKNIQDADVAPALHYVRFVGEVHQSQLDHESGDEDEDAADRTKPLRVAICMSKQASHRLLEAQYLQCDIAFKRVVGFYEFELSGYDRSAKIGLVYCRVFVTRQTAAAHLFIFQNIDRIVKEDTGQPLQWRHLHAKSLLDFPGILTLTADQHRGQAKGLGLYLSSLAEQLPKRYDLHETHRTLSELGPYDHLHRIFRLCYTHNARNIKKSAVSEDVKNLMRSLVCVVHDDFDGTVQAIIEKGGKAGLDWVQDKQRSKFAFEGLCWEKSFIPKVIWQAADRSSNISEILHFDVNLEGIRCTLVGGIKKGHHYDTLKWSSLKVQEEMGIRPSYQRGHISENTIRDLKRKANWKHSNLATQDDKIINLNKKIKLADTARSKAQNRLTSVQVATQVSADTNDVAIGKATQALAKATASHAKTLQGSLRAVGSGSGKIGVVLVPSQAGT